MSSTVKPSLLLWDIKRTHWAYRVLAIVLLFILIVYPSSNNPWFRDGEITQLSSGVQITLKQKRLLLLLEVPEADQVEEAELTSFVEERFGADAVLHKTDDARVYRVKIGDFR
jgi:hypothetical protein